MDTYQQKLSHLKALYHLACSDNELSQVEATYIFNVAERLGVDAEELVDFDGSEPDLDLPDRQYKLYAVFHRLVMVIKIDNVASEGFVMLNLLRKWKGTCTPTSLVYSGAKDEGDWYPEGAGGIIIADAHLIDVALR